jgi:hypothetical protein
MAVAAQHALNSPILAWLILVATELLTTYCAINYLLSAEDVQAKLLHVQTHKKTYLQIDFLS